MKKFLLSLAIIFLAFPATIFAGSASQNFKEYVVVSPDEIIDGDFIAAGERIDIYGTVQGDLYVAGGIVNVEGIVEGDVLVAGGQVDISGEVGQDLRAIGGEINISGIVQKNITILGGDVEIARSAQINRNVYVGAGNFYIAGAIDGDLFYATDPETERITETASVSGTISKYEHEGSYQYDKQTAREATTAFGFITKFISLLSTLLLGLLVIKYLPLYADRASELITKSFWKSFLAGILGFILLPTLAVISMITIVGLPIGIMLFAILIVYGFIARVYVMIAIGKKVSQWTGSKISSEMLIFIVGLLSYYLLSLIPIVGALIKFFVIVAGFGAALRNIRNTYFIARGKKIL